MAKARKTKHNLPGSIYKNGSRYWWKVKLPGENKTKARPLIPVNSRQAAKEYGVAVECARIMLAKVIFESGQASSDRIEYVPELVKAYLKHVDDYYRDENGNPTREPLQIRYSVKPLVDCFATLAIEEFGPLKLMDLREYMIKLNWSRGLINQRIGRIKRMFKWAVSRQIISSVSYHGLMTVEGLKKGRCEAKETKPVKPAEPLYVYACLPYMTPVVAAMVELQLLTGMRPGELVIMRPCDIDRTGEVWHYCPDKHKNQYRGIERIVSIGPRGQKILRPFLLRDQRDYCFSPADSEKRRLAALHKKRVTPIKYGNKPGSNRKENPKTKPGNVFTSGTYGNSVRKAVKAARGVIKKRGGNPDKELPKWTPYQLRHTAATKVRKMFNYETAGAVLGHTNMSATAIYAERNQGLADEAARKFG